MAFPDHYTFPCLGSLLTRTKRGGSRRILRSCRIRLHVDSRQGQTDADMSRVRSPARSTFLTHSLSRVGTRSGLTEPLGVHFPVADRSGPCRFRQLVTSALRSYSFANCNMIDWRSGSLITIARASNCAARSNQCFGSTGIRKCLTAETGFPRPLPGRNNIYWTARLR